ncbi:LysR substrate-binding domain-containing protein [Priestia megaterium]|uniref:LysR substrate-binding domain-containing protein n=1 Tax=Priestia megaterium TaxID=1404 RepID=UPI00366ECFC8
MASAFAFIGEPFSIWAHLVIYINWKYIYSFIYYIVIGIIVRVCVEKLFSLCKIHNVNKPIIGLQINGLNETIRTVIAGYGVTFVSSLEVNEHLAQEQVAIVHVEEVNLKNPISLCTREKDELSNIALNFIDSIETDMN